MVNKHYLSFNLCDRMQWSFGFGQEDPGESNASLPAWYEEVKREWRAGSKPRSRQTGVVLRVHPERMELQTHTV